MLTPDARNCRGVKKPDRAEYPCPSLHGNPVAATAAITWNPCLRADKDDEGNARKATPQARNTEFVDEP